MKAGCCKVDITPKTGTPIGGNIREDNRSRGVHDSLYANFLYLNDDGNALLFIGLDIIGIFESFGRLIKGGIHKTTGIPPESIILFATHTHSGPDVMEAFKDEYDPLVTSFIEELTRNLIEGASVCTQNVWEASVGIGKGYEDSLSFNRRIFMRDGKLRMNWEGLDPSQVDRAAGPIDPDVFVISVMDERKTIRSILVNFTLHTAILVGKDWLISRDYVHSLTERLENRFGKDTVVLFANGAEGDINHLDVSNPRQPRGFEEAERIGNHLADRVGEVLQTLEYSDMLQLKSISKMISLPRRKISEAQAHHALQLLEKSSWKIPSLLDGVPDEAYAKEILALSHKEEFLQTELQAVQLGDHALLSLPGEFFVELGLSIKECSPYVNTLIFGMANDYVGYVPTESAFEEGGYEIKTARTSQLTPQAGEMVVRESTNLLTGLKGGECL
ncbi:MAG: hypothetical protein WD469_15240 [Paenibacillaceae bacterium]